VCEGSFGATFAKSLWPLVDQYFKPHEHIKCGLLRRPPGAPCIDIIFGVKSHGNPRNIVLNRGSPFFTAIGRVFDAAFTTLLWPLVADRHTDTQTLVK